MAGDRDGALRAAQKAVSVTSVGPSQAFALAIQSRIALASGQTKAARKHAVQAYELLQAHGEVVDGEMTMRLAYAQALAATDAEDEARQAIALARDRLTQRADKITDQRLRQSLLERVPEHATILRLAPQWSDQA